MRKYLFIAIILLSPFFVLHAQFPGVRYKSSTQIGTVNNQKITEASGIASSQLLPNTFWLHNDSGDGPNIFLIDSDGNTLTSGAVASANARDWEDITSFTIDDKAYLLIGDVGDNPQNKQEYYLYLLEEPVYDPSSTTNNIFPIIKRITFVYEDGANNCESIAVDELNKKIYLVSKKGGNSCKAYELPLTIEPGSSTLTARAIANLYIPGTTAMDISADGLRSVVLTYEDAYEYLRYEGESWAEGFSHTPNIVTMPQRPGGEAITYGPDGKTLYLVREGSSSPVWEVQPISDSGVVFQLDLYEISDLENGGNVWLNLPDLDTSVVMTDNDGDGIFYCRFYIPHSTDVNYYFSYQNGPDANMDIEVESISETCSNLDGLRVLYIHNTDITLKPVLFSNCGVRPDYVTFNVDLSDVTDIFEGGNVWLSMPKIDTSFLMNDTNGDKVYSFTYASSVGTNLKYIYSYQNGANPITDRNVETLTSECSETDGLRTQTVQEGHIELLAPLFGSCEEALPEGSDITDIKGAVIRGSNDNQPWISATEGAGSPSGQEVEVLIDNNVNTKYLVRAVDSWVEIITNRLSKVNAYSITSASDVDSRDPRSWELQGWNTETSSWDLIHTVVDNPIWQERLQRKSWHFNNDTWYSRYRLHIHAINGNTQNLMQMAELQLFGELGEFVEWSNNAILKTLSISKGSITPAFSPSIFSYNVEVPYGTQTLIIEAESSDSSASITGTGIVNLFLGERTAEIEVIAEDGYTTQSYTVNITVSEATLSKTERLNEPILIYPNPTKGELNIYCPNSNTYKLILTDITGRNIIYKNIHDSSHQIDLSGLRRGFYWLLIDGNNGLYSRKIILE